MIGPVEPPLIVRGAHTEGAAFLEDAALLPRQLPVQDGLGLPVVGQPPGYIHRAVVPPCIVAPVPRREQAAVQLQIAQLHCVCGLPLRICLHHGLHGAVRVDELEALHPQNVPLPRPAGGPGIGAVRVFRGEAAPQGIELVDPAVPVLHNPLRQGGSPGVVQPAVQIQIPGCPRVDILRAAIAPGQLGAEFPFPRPDHQGHSAVQIGQRLGRMVQTYAQDSGPFLALVNLVVLPQAVYLRFGPLDARLHIPLQPLTRPLDHHGHDAQPQQGESHRQGPHDPPEQLHVALHATPPPACSPP